VRRERGVSAEGTDGARGGSRGSPGGNDVTDDRLDGSPRSERLRDLRGWLRRLVFAGPRLPAVAVRRFAGPAAAARVRALHDGRAGASYRLERSDRFQNVIDGMAPLRVAA
jgi:hypothetical protein